MRTVSVPVCALLVAVAGRADDAVWDPAEYIRLAQQASQMSLNISATQQLSQQFSGLSAALGSAGARGPPLASIVLSLGAMSSVGSGQMDLVAPAATGTVSASQSRQSFAALRQAQLAAATDGYALALMVNQDLAGAGGRAQQLAAQAAAASDTRADLQANSAVCLSILAELNGIEALLALRLQQRALRHMAAATPGGD